MFFVVSNQNKDIFYNVNICNCLYMMQIIMLFVVLFAREKMFMDFYVVCGKTSPSLSNRPTSFF